jgi:hypothetical protein
VLNYKCAIPRLLCKRRAPAAGRDNNNGKINRNNNRKCSSNSKDYKNLWPSFT